MWTGTLVHHERTSKAHRGGHIRSPVPGPRRRRPHLLTTVTPPRAPTEMAQFIWTNAALTTSHGGQDKSVGLIHAEVSFPSQDNDCLFHNHTQQRRAAM